MRLQEGPAFGALIIGGGFGYFLYMKTQNVLLAASVGIAVALADYILLVWINNFKKKK